MTRSAAFDWTVTAISAYFVGGLFLDGWAHTHGQVDESFFTPWHAVLYSGFLAAAVFLGGAVALGRMRGSSWRAAVPDGYGASLVGVALWLFGGPFDFAWHEVFGFEADVEALMSPAHTVLAVGLALIASGPIRATLRRPPAPWRRDIASVVGLTCVVSVITFFTQIAHPASNVWGARRASPDGTELALVGLLLTAAILFAPLLLLLRHGRLPAGAVAILVGLNAIAMGFVYDRGPYPLVPVIALVAGGVGADALRALMRPEASRPAAFRAFAFAAPALVHACYFAALALTTGIAWRTHLWLGVIVFCGVVGWLLSLLALPPRVVHGA